MFNKTNTVLYKEKKENQQTKYHTSFIFIAKFLKTKIFINGLVSTTKKKK